MEKAKILIVEDEAIIAKVTEKSLRKLGFEIVAIVDTGEKAIEKAEADRPDIILMDIRINGELDGIDTAKIIRSRFQIPIIFTTAYIDEERIQRSKTAIPFGYLLKPVRERDLKVTIDMAMYVAKVDAERKQTEEIIHSSHLKQKALIENIADVIAIVDQTGINRYKSPNVEKWFGWKPEDLIGKDTWENVHPDDLERVQRVFNELIQNDNSLVMEEYRYLCKNGKYKWIETSATNRIHDKNINGILLNFHDITKRKNAEQELIVSKTEAEENEKKYRLLLTNTLDTIWSTDFEFNLVYVNNAIYDFLGYLPDEFIGLNPSVFTPPEGLQSIQKSAELLIARYNEGEIIQDKFELQQVRKDGTLIDVEIRSNLLLDDTGQIVGFQGRSIDITERKKTQELLIQTEKMVSVGGLAAGMAHEINNPLGGILQGTQNVLRRLSPDLKSNDKLSDETGVDLQKLQLYMEKRGILSLLKGIQESGKKAAEIISSMLQFSRKSESRMAPSNLVELVENALVMAGKDYDLKKKYDFKTIKIIREFEPNLPLVPCTETEIEQVFLNLLKNAAQAMAEADLKVPQLIIRLLPDRNAIKIEIEDNGPGIDDATRKRIFEPFFTTKPVGKGTGLGLSVSYMIITNNHEGTMEVDSKPGKGARFTIQLPLVRELSP